MDRIDNQHKNVLTHAAQKHAWPFGFVDRQARLAADADIQMWSPIP